jgi:hypothetical protein
MTPGNRRRVPGDEGSDVANYVLVFKGGSVPESEAEQQKVMADWGAWYGSMGAAVVDGGTPFGPSKSIAGDGTVSDGAASALTGYTIITAGSLDAAADLSKGCPILAGGAGSIEIYETLEM